MEYRDSVEKSAEYLRLALPLMSRQAAALHPVSYAVWYEYVAGTNSALRTTIDEHTRDGSPLDEKATFEIFRKHVAGLDHELAQRVSDRFQKVLADMSQSAQQAGDHADQFGNALAKFSEEVNSGDSELGADVVLHLSRNMQASISMLKGRLDDSRREIDQLRQEVTRAREDALADGLTGLVNRRGFDMALDARLSRGDPEESGPSLLIVDIDHFKRVNDNYGHVFGDKVIRAVAQILKDNVKGKDTAARYGGEEFCILLPETSLDGARYVAEKIRSTVEKCRIKRLDNKEVVANVTVSVGAACLRGGESASEFVARADAALYKSKTDGRNRTTLAA